MSTSLPFNIFTALIAPIVVPFIEQTISKSEKPYNDFKINKLYGVKLKPKDESQTPDKDIIEDAKVIDKAIIPFFRGLPGAYVGNIICGMTYKMNGFDWWFFIYFTSLIICLGLVNIIKTQIVSHIGRVYFTLLFFGLIFVILTFLRLTL